MKGVMKGMSVREREEILYKEVGMLIREYMMEYEVTEVQVVGVLEVLKGDVMSCIPLED